MPEQKTTSALFDEIDYQGAVQAYLWAIPIVGFTQRYANNIQLGAMERR